MYPEDLNAFHFEYGTYNYIFLVIGISLSIRVVSSALRALEYCIKKKLEIRYYFCKFFWHTMKGCCKKKEQPDLWYNTIIGTIELLIFPILIKYEGITIIGAWISLKTIAQWKVWNKNRLVFNRYVLMHAILLIASFWLSTMIIKDKSTAHVQEKQILHIKPQKQGKQVFYIKPKKRVDTLMIIVDSCTTQ